VPVPIEEAKAFGVMTVNEGRRIVEFAEKPENPKAMADKPGKALASMGIYVFTASFLRDRLLADAKRETPRHDFGRDMIPTAVRSANVFGFPFVNADTRAPQYWRDIGTLDGYWEAHMDLVSEQPELDLYDPTWPIWSKQEQLPPAKFLFDENGRRGHAVDSLVSEGCRISGAAVRRTVLFSNVRIHSYSQVEESLVLPDTEVHRNCSIKRTILDQGVVIPDGMEIGHDLEKDRERFEVSEGGVVLVTADMLSLPAN
jgi:glucose-1-phosphate adenylyltransferase